MITAAQEQALRTRYIRRVIDKDDVDEKCRMCCERDETVVYQNVKCWHRGSISNGCELETVSKIQTARKREIV